MKIIYLLLLLVLVTQVIAVDVPLVNKSIDKEMFINESLSFIDEFKGVVENKVSEKVDFSKFIFYSFVFMTIIIVLIVAYKLGISPFKVMIYGLISFFVYIVWRLIS